MAPFRGSFILRLTFCTDPPPYILNCRHAKTKRSWDLNSLSFRDSPFAPTPPPIFWIAATRKRNGVEISNSQNFLVSMISTSILKKKKIHDIGCTPLFELGWNDPYALWFISQMSDCLFTSVYKNAIFASFALATDNKKELKSC